jgi:hypothetical protein
MTIPPDKFNIAWFDLEHTILICEIKETWTWDEAYIVINEMNDLCSTVNHGVYTIFHFQGTTALFPVGGSAINNIRRLASINSENDELVFFVRSNAMVSRLIKIAGQVYKLAELTGHFRFVQNLEEALVLIQQHKNQQKDKTLSRKDLKS